MLQDEFGLRVKPYPTTQMSSETVASNPALRAKDLNDAFEDSEVQAIIASIGGDDSTRILRFLDPQKAIDNPKILMGYSDATAFLTYYHHLPGKRV